jgi:hypothetical protein
MELSAQIEAEERLESSEFGLGFRLIDLGLNELADRGRTHPVHIQVRHPEGIGADIRPP